MQTEIKHQWFFNHPPEKVWDYLTKPELIEQWLMKNNFAPVPGHEFQFHSAPKPAMELNGINYCKVLEIVPFKKLVYSWKSGPGNGVIVLDTIVEWTLQEQDNGTQLYLKHTGFTEANNALIYPGMNTGWNNHVTKIINALNTGSHE